MMLGAGVLYVFCLTMTSIAQEFWQFYLAQGLGVGLAMGFLFTPALSTIGHHFAHSRHRYLAMGIFFAGPSVGGTIFPIMLRKLFSQMDFGWSVRIRTASSTWT
jgi:MFS family permease